jgi:hypothetical protein
MRRADIRSFLVLFILTIFGIVFIAGGWFKSVHADTQPTPGPDRHTTILVEGTEYNWWLVYWSDNTIACVIAIDHEGKPTQDDVLNDCGAATFDKWLHTPACSGEETGSALQACKGMYLHNIGSQDVSRELEVDLPPAVVWVDLIGCEFDPEQKTCNGIPSLHFTGEESLPNEQILKINVKLDGESFNCEGSECTVPLESTDEKGVPFSFWGESSYGDETIVYEGLVRVVPKLEATPQPEETITPTSYYVDILSSQWKTGQSATCAEIWQVFPEIGTSPIWLDTPQDAEELHTSIPYYYLAAMLIKNGVVDASECDMNGLESDLSANQCGLEKAQESVTEWQNQFDEQILQTSLDSGIPGQLLKNLFAQESQLWPGIYSEVKEAGFGQLTENGADAALLWNRSFYDQFCPLVLAQETCDKGFAMLPDAQQTILKGALEQKVNASCADCPAGIDISQANFSIHVFAETLVGNCSQVDRVLYNVTKKTTSSVATYSDLWRFSLLNYTAGPGCLFDAVSRTYKAKNPLDWIHVAANLPPTCRPAVDYVSRVSQGESESNIAFSTALPTATRTPILPTKTQTLTRTATLTRTVTPTRTDTRTATATASASPTITLTPELSYTPSLTPTRTPTSTPTPGGFYITPKSPQPVSYTADMHPR